MQTVSKYADLYQRKHQQSPFSDTLSAKNETYVCFLETQLDKVTASINLVSSFDQRILELEKQNTQLKEKILDQNKYIKLFQNFAEIQEEENTNIQDKLDDIRSQVNSSQFEQQFQLMKSSLNQSLKQIDTYLSENFQKYQKTVDQKFSAFQERIQNQVLNKFQNFGGLQDLIEERLQEIRNEINAKIQCLFQEIQDTVTQSQIEQIQKDLRLENKQNLQKINEIEEKIGYKQQFLNDLAEELMEKADQQKKQGIQLQHKIDETNQQLDEFIKLQKKNQQEQEQIIQKQKDDLTNKIKNSFDQLSSLFLQHFGTEQKKNIEKSPPKKSSPSSQQHNLNDLDISSSSNEQYNAESSQYSEKADKLTLKKQGQNPQFLKKPPQKTRVKPDKEVKKFK